MVNFSILKPEPRTKNIGPKPEPRDSENVRIPVVRPPEGGGGGSGLKLSEK